MIEVSVADAIYCSAGICQPLTWWASAAAWAQALLTVVTFAGTVIYQILQNKKLYQSQQAADTRATFERIRSEVSLARIIVSREFRRWRRSIRIHLDAKHEDIHAEARATIELAKNFNWNGNVHDLMLMGDLGQTIIDLVATVDGMLDMIEGPLRQHLEDNTPLDELVVSVRQKLRSLEASLGTFVDKLNDFGKQA